MRSGSPVGWATEATTALKAGQLALRRGDSCRGRRRCSSNWRGSVRDAAGKLRGQILERESSIAADAGTPSGKPSRRSRDRSASSTLDLGSYLAGLLVRLSSHRSIDDWVVARRRRRHVPAVAPCRGDRRQPRPAGPRRRWHECASEARLRPERWCSALRLLVARGAIHRAAAAALLAEIGSSRRRRAPADGCRNEEGAPSLCRWRSRSDWRSPSSSRTSGQSRCRSGPLLPRALRRKVLALALLPVVATRDGGHSRRGTRCPLAGPRSRHGGNSLHQTIYFLRRVFEPDYREGMSAGYIQFDGEVVSLDPTLVDSCESRVLAATPSRQPRRARRSLDRLLELYSGRYALDFAYEDWAADYRDNLHAAVLAAVEAESVRARSPAATSTARFGWVTTLLAIDPQADAIELELLRAYKASGRHAAAAEQYAHYASFDARRTRRRAALVRRHLGRARRGTPALGMPEQPGVHR